ncbi:hypothetical protein N9976_01420, partial [bacterium]|nr:hypothetical protein [bacterium]
DHFRGLLFWNHPELWLLIFSRFFFLRFIRLLLYEIDFLKLVIRIWFIGRRILLIGMVQQLLKFWEFLNFFVIFFLIFHPGFLVAG